MLYTIISHSLTQPQKYTRKEMQKYDEAYAKFEAVLYGVTEKDGITVEGAEIDAEMVSSR